MGLQESGAGQHTQHTAEHHTHLAVERAGDAGVREGARVAPRGLLCWVCKGAVLWLVGLRLGARRDLQEVESAAAAASETAASEQQRRR